MKAIKCLPLPCVKEVQLFYFVVSKGTFLFKTNHLISQDDPLTLVSFGSHWNYSLLYQRKEGNVHLNHG